MEPKAVSFTIKNLPPGIHRLLKQRATQHRRSLNGEIIEVLRLAVEPRKVDVEAMIAGARELRERIGGYLTDAEITRAKRHGRK